RDLERERIGNIQRRTRAGAAIDDSNLAVGQRAFIEQRQVAARAGGTMIDRTDDIAGGGAWPFQPVEKATEGREKGVIANLERQYTASDIEHGGRHAQPATSIAADGASTGWRNTVTMGCCGA